MVQLTVYEARIANEARIADMINNASVGFYEMKMMVISIVRGCDDFTRLDKGEIIRSLAGQLIMFTATADDVRSIRNNDIRHSYGPLQTRAKHTERARSVDVATQVQCSAVPIDDIDLHPRAEDSKMSVVFVEQQPGATDIIRNPDMIDCTCVTPPKSDLQRNDNNGVSHRSVWRGVTPTFTNSADTPSRGSHGSQLSRKPTTDTGSSDKQPNKKRGMGWSGGFNNGSKQAQAYKFQELGATQNKSTDTTENFRSNSAETEFKEQNGNTDSSNDGTTIDSNSAQNESTQTEIKL
ncbi:hypothetical protein Tco_0942052, partial [Tanacetum coccineum]